MPTIRRRFFAPAAVLIATALLAAGTATATPPATNAADAGRTGWYPNQSALTPGLVSGSSFGQLFKTDLETGDQVDAQPLVAANTLLVVTEQNNVYGLDPVTGAERWARQVGAPVLTADATRDPAAPGEAGCDVPRHYTGITGTPVVDADGTAYFLAKRYVSGTTGAIAYQAHAVDMATGAERSGYPITLPDGMQADNQTGAFAPAFHAQWQLQRPGLLLLDGVVYAAFAGHCDRGHYEGWVVGVTATGGQSAPAIRGKWVAVASTPGAGIWQSGGGLVSDGPGRILLTTGNGRSPTGTAPMAAPPADLGSSVVRLQVGAGGALRAADFFAPYDGELLDRQDVDFGSGGPVALPDAQFGTAAHPHLMVSVGKQGIVYLLNRDDLGGYRTGTGGGDRVLQQAGPIGGVWSRPSVWPGDGGWLWVNTASGGGVGGGGDGRLEALGYGTTPAGEPLLLSEATSTDAFSIDSGAPVVTSDGVADRSGIVWIEWAPYEGFGAQLRAYSAVPGPDRHPVMLGSWPIGRSGKFQSPGVGAGRLYVGARGCLAAYEPGRCTADTKAAVIGFGSPVVQPLSGSSLRFDATQVGQSQTRDEVFTATRALTVTALSSSSAAFTVGAPAGRTLPATLNAGDELRMPVTFSPGAAGTSAGELTAATSAGGVSVGLSGDGLTPAAELRVVTTVSFGGTVIGGHAGQAIRLFNDGGSPLHVSAVGAPAAASAFRLPAPPATPFTIPSAGSVLVQVDFDPPSAGRFEGALEITSDGGHATVVLSGSAASPAHVAVTPLGIDFGDVLLGTPAQRTFTVTNTGGSTAVISRSQPPGLGRFQALTSLVEGTTIAPGESVTERVRFTPEVAGPARDAWSINANDDVGRRSVDFAGMGTAPPVFGPVVPDAGSVPDVAGGGPPPPVGLAGAGGADRTAPRLTGLRRSGRTLHVTISEPGRLRIAIDRLVGGRRGTAGGRCQAPTRANRHGRPCTRAIAVRTLLRTVTRAGAVSVTLPRLPAARYRLTASASDASGNRGQARPLGYRVAAGRR
jgi:hypothetical protein